MTLYTIQMYNNTTIAARYNTGNNSLSLKIQKLDGIENISNAIGPLWNNTYIQSNGCAISSDGSKIILAQTGGYLYGNPSLSSLTLVAWGTTPQGVAITPNGTRGVIGDNNVGLYPFTWSGSSPTIGTIIGNTTGLKVRSISITSDGSIIAIISDGTQHYATWNSSTSQYDSAIQFGNLQYATSCDITNDGQNIFITCQNSANIYMSKWNPFNNTYSYPSNVFTLSYPIQSLILLKPNQNAMIVCCNNGSMYYSYYNGTYSLFNPNFSLILPATTNELSTTIANCWDMAIDNNGNLYIPTGGTSTGYIYKLVIFYNPSTVSYFYNYQYRIKLLTSTVPSIDNTGTFSITNNGTVTTFYDPTRSGFVLSFSGSNYLQLQSTVVTSSTSTRTFWLRTSAATSGGGNIVSSTNWQIWFGGTNYISSQSGNTKITDPTNEGTGWVFYAITSSSTTTSLYVNGVLVATNAISPNWGGDSSVIQIGAYSGGNYFTGYLDDIRQYSYVLTSDQIMQLYLTTTSNSNIPVSIPGNVLWLDATDTSTLNISNNTATIWNDKSGLGNNGSATSGATWSSTGLNNKPAITYSSSSTTHTNYFSGNVSITGSTASVFIICLANSTITSYGRLIGFSNSSSGADYDSGSYFNFQSNGTSFGLTRASAINGLSPSPPYSTPYLIEGWFDGTNSNVMAQYGSNIVSTGSTGTFSISNYSIGDIPSGGTGLSGAVSEVLVFNTSLSEIHRRMIEGYLSWKWGLQSNLLPTHTFYNNAPNSDILNYQFRVKATSTTVPTKDATGNYTLTTSTFGSGMSTVSVVYDNVRGYVLSFSCNTSANNNYMYVQSANTMVTPGSTRTFWVKLLSNSSSGNFFSSTSFSIGHQGTLNNIFITYNNNVSQQAYGYTLLNQWVFIAVTITSTNISVYLNDNSTPVINYTGTFLSETTNVPYFGAYYITGLGGMTGNGFTGYLDDMRQYPYVLTTQQILQIYNSTNMNTVIPVQLTPTLIPGNFLWLDAADTKTVVSSSNIVSQWNDKSPNGYNFINSKSVNVAYGNPTTGSSSSTNGLNAITMGSSVGLRNASITLPSYTTIFIVSNPGSVSLGYSYYFSTPQSGNNFYVLGSYQGQYQDSPKLGGNYYGVYNSSGGILQSSTTYINEITFNGSSVNIFNTGNLLKQQSAIVANPSFGQGIYIGNDSSSYNWAGSVCEVIIYNSGSAGISDINRQMIEGYLAWKWGIQTNLPFMHTFYNSAPTIDILNYQFRVKATSFSVPSLDATSNYTITNNASVTIAYDTIRGYVFNFSGSNYLSIAAATNLTPVNCTRTLWVKTSTPTAGTGNVFSSSSLPIWFASSNYINVKPGSTTRLADPVYEGSNWVFYAVTVTSTTMSIYVNGKLIPNVSSSVSGWSGDSTAVQFGYFASSSGTNYTGYLDDMRQYPYVLTPEQIQQIYNSTNKTVGVSLYTPASSTTFTGMNLWLDAADTSTITYNSSDSTISQWNDKSTNIFGFTQSTSGNRPTIVTNSQNGLPTVRFSSSNKQFLGGPTSYSVGTNSWTIFAVFKTDDNTSGASIFNKSLQGPANNRILFVRVANINATFDMGFGNNSLNPLLLKSTEDYTANTYRIMSYTYARRSGNDYIHRNGTQNVSGSPGVDTSTDLTNSYPMIIGGYNSNTITGSIDTPADNLYLTGNICEILAYATPYDMGEIHRQTIEGYLSWKWGLQTTLPPLHAFYTSPPFIDVLNYSFRVKSVTNVVPTYDATGSVQLTNNQVNSVSVVMYNDPTRGSVFSFSGASTTGNQKGYLSTTNTVTTKASSTRTFWIKTTATSADIYQSTGIQIWIDANGYLKVKYGSGTTYTSNTLVGSAWRFIAVVTTSTTIKVYFDNNNTPVIDVGSQSISDDTSKVYFGSAPSGSASQFIGDFTGYLDDMRQYDTSLTTQQILQIYNSTLPKALINLDTDPALKFYYKFLSSDVDANSKVYNYATKTNDLTLIGDANGKASVVTGTSYNTSKINYSLYLNNASNAKTQYATSSTSFTHTLANGFTFSGWFLCKNEIGSYARICELIGGASNSNRTECFATYDSANDFVYYGVAPGPSTSFVENSFGYKMPLGSSNTTWVHIAMVIAPGTPSTTTYVSNSYNLYVNGVLQSAIQNNAYFSNVARTMSIGNNFFNNPYFYGYINEYRIYDRALNSEEIRVLYSI